MFSKLEAQILTSLTYSSLFNYPLSKEELELRLVAADKLDQFWPRLNNLNWLDRKNCNMTHALRYLVKKGKVVKHKKQFFPHDFFLTEINPFELRVKKKHWSQQLRQELGPILSYAQKHSWIKAVAITGSAALNSAWQGDDVDLMIVTQKKRLWIVRTTLLFWGLIKGKKKLFKASSKQDWCFNLWLSEDKLGMGTERRSLYTAFEICQADWICQTEGLERRFLETNSWVKDYLPNYYQSKMQQASSKTEDRSGNRKVNYIFNFVLSGLNRVLFWLERVYINLKLGIPSEHLRLDQAFFHKKASSQTLLIRLKRRLVELDKT